jgi:P-type Mg2+ transporter
MDSQNKKEKKTMVFKEYALKKSDAIITELGSSLTEGLSADAAARKLTQFGKNQQNEQDVSLWHILFHHMTSMFVVLFFMIDIFFMILGEWSNAGIVLLLILINIGVGCYQEFKASKTIKLLKKYIENVSMVLRDGKQQEIETSDLVPGDILFLRVGSIVPADIRIVSEKGLMIDEATITGESAPVKKIASNLEGEVDLFKAFNIGFTGTLVVEGEATGVVFATADKTIFGSLLKNSYRSWQESTLEKAVIQLSKFIFVLSVVSLLCVGVGNIIVKGYANFDIIEMLVFATALMVCLVPEALPIVITFNLSLCVRRLLKMNVVVKRLSALEDFGAVEILCVDKTGTLTEQDLKVVNTFAVSDADALFRYIGLSVLPHLAQDHNGTKNSFETAIDQFLTKNHSALFVQACNEYEYVSSCPFDPTRRRFGVLVKRKNTTEYWYILRGAYEIMENVCFIGDKDAQQWIHQEGSKGNRTLAVAVKKLSSEPDDLIAQEQDLTLAGLLAFSDPIKRTAMVALEQARDLGLAIKVISGDAPEVCGSVAYALQLIDDPKKVVTSHMLQAASIEEKVQLIKEGVVFSRVLPDQKAEIVEILKRDKRIGFMGDGLNDLPALMMADVALVVQGCPDVVREAGDIILLNRSLISVIHAIKEGRTVLANTMKYIKTTFSPSFGHFYALTIASLFVKGVPMLPIQILLLNFFSDFPMISLATDTVEPAELSHPQQYNIKNILFIAVVLGMVSMIFDFICFSYFINKAENTMQTGWFMETVLTEILFIFAIRSRQPFFKATRPSLTLSLCALTTIAATFIIPYTALGQRIFKFTVLDKDALFFVCGLVIVYFFCVEIIKYMYYQSSYFKNGNGVKKA